MSVRMSGAGRAADIDASFADDGRDWLPLRPDELRAAELAWLSGWLDRIARDASRGLSGPRVSSTSRQEATAAARAAAVAWIGQRWHGWEPARVARTLARARRSAEVGGTTVWGAGIEDVARSAARASLRGDQLRGGCIAERDASGLRIADIDSPPPSDWGSTWASLLPVDLAEAEADARDAVAHRARLASLARWLARSAAAAAAAAYGPRRAATVGRWHRARSVVLRVASGMPWSTAVLVSGMEPRAVSRAVADVLESARRWAAANRSEASS